MPLTVVQFAERQNVSAKTVKNWLTRGLLPGSVVAKDPNNHGVWTWFIPDDAQAPQTAKKRKARHEEAQQKDPLGSPADPIQYIKLNHKTMSIKHFSQVLGVSPQDVRSTYDAMHAGGMFDDDA